MIRKLVRSCSETHLIPWGPHPAWRRLGTFFYGLILAGVMTTAAYGSEITPFKKGVQAFRAKEYERAQQSFLESLRRDSGNAIAHYYLGLTYNRLDQPKDALTSFQTARKLDPSLPGLSLSLGTAYFKLGLHEQALPELEQARTEEPENGTVYFLLGRVRQELRQYPDSNRAFETAARLDKEFQQQSEYYIAINYFRQGKLPEARTVFRKSMTGNPDSPMAKAARDYLDSFHTSRRQQKKFWYQAGMGWMYDDNVTSSAQDVVSSDGDAAFTFEAGVGIRLLEKRQFYLEATYDVYQSTFFKLDEFNLQSHTLGLSANKTKGPWDLGLDYLFNYNLLGGDSFLLTHSFVGSAGVSWNSRNYTRFSYMLQPRNFLQAVNDPRDGLDNHLGIDHFLFTPDGRKHFQASYRFIDEITDGDPFDYVGHTLTLAVQVPTRYEGKLKLRYTYLHKDFKNITPSIGAERWDQRHTYQIAWTRMFLKTLEFKAEFQHIINLSNFPVVDFSENIIAISGRFLF